jgi:transposase
VLVSLYDLACMAPKLSAAKHEILRRLITNGLLTDEDIHEAVPCSVRSVEKARHNLRRVGTTTAPGSRGGRPRVTDTPTIKTLLERLKEEDDLNLDEQAYFLWKRDRVRRSKPTISRALKLAGWTDKKHREIAEQRNEDLRDGYRYALASSSVHSWQVIYIDESGCDERMRFRRKGWGPRGKTPVRRARFQRGTRFQILTAFSQDGVVLSRVYQGPTNGAVIEDFIEQLLCHCCPWPGPRSVLIWDNATIHYPDKVKQLCKGAGVRLIFLPPYSPDLNPIEEHFGELKAFIRYGGKIFMRDGQQTFEEFLKSAIKIVGKRMKSARGHFRHSGWIIEEYKDSSAA